MEQMNFNKDELQVLYTALKFMHMGNPRNQLIFRLTAKIERALKEIESK